MVTGGKPVWIRVQTFPYRLIGLTIIITCWMTEVIVRWSTWPQLGDVSAHGVTLKWKAVDKPSAKLQTIRRFRPVNCSRKVTESQENRFTDILTDMLNWKSESWHITQIDTRNVLIGVPPSVNCTTFLLDLNLSKEIRTRHARKSDLLWLGMSWILTFWWRSDILWWRHQDKTIPYVEMIPFGSWDWGEGCVILFRSCGSFHIDTTKTWKNETVSDSSKPRCFVVTRGWYVWDVVIVFHLVTESSNNKHPNKITKTQVQHGHIINFAVHARDRTYRRLHDECRRHDVSSRGRG